VRQLFTQFVPAYFSDLRIEIDFFLAESDRVDRHFVALFKHTGKMGKVSAEARLALDDACAAVELREPFLLRTVSSPIGAEFLQQSRREQRVAVLASLAESVNRFANLDMANSVDNIQTLCLRCHKLKTARDQ
jgi:5-methylcytosine-specific restriction endonuclease McrA